MVPVTSAARRTATSGGGLKQLSGEEPPVAVFSCHFPAISVLGAWKWRGHAFKDDAEQLLIIRTLNRPDIDKLSVACFLVSLCARGSAKPSVSIPQKGGLSANTRYRFWKGCL